MLIISDYLIHLLIFGQRQTWRQQVPLDGEDLRVGRVAAAIVPGPPGALQRHEAAVAPSKHPVKADCVLGELRLQNTLENIQLKSTIKTNIVFHPLRQVCS